MALRNSFLYDRTRYYEPFFLATFSHLYINITRVLPSCFVFALYFSSRLAFEPQIRGQGLSPLSPLGTVPFFIAGRHQQFLPSPTQVALALPFTVTVADTVADTAIVTDTGDRQQLQLPFNFCYRLPFMANR